MRTIAGILFVFTSLVSPIHIKAVILPDACGDDSEKFTVSTQKHPSPLGPEAGQAQIVFIEKIDKELANTTCIGCNVTTRIGLDGKWVGANQGDSYFATNVSPGEHHLCANWQSRSGSLGKNVDIASLEAEPGKIYYFEARVLIADRDAGHGHTYSIYQLTLKKLSDDEGQYRVKINALSTAKPKK